MNPVTKEAARCFRNECLTDAIVAAQTAVAFGLPESVNPYEYGSPYWIQFQVSHRHECKRRGVVVAESEPQQAGLWQEIKHAFLWITGRVNA